MTASTAPTPDKCPACNANLGPVADNEYIGFACGNAAINKSGEWEFTKRCAFGYSAAIALRQKLADEKTANECLQDELTVLRAERDALGQDIAKLAQQRNAAFSEMHAIRSAIRANPKEATSDEVARVVAERDAARARLAELQAQVTECAEVMAYCRPSFPHIMGNDDWAIEQIKKQCELGERFDNLIVALASGAVV